MKSSGMTRTGKLIFKELERRTTIYFNITFRGPDRNGNFTAPDGSLIYGDMVTYFHSFHIGMDSCLLRKDCTVEPTSVFPVYDNKKECIRIKKETETGLCLMSILLPLKFIETIDVAHKQLFFRKKVAYARCGKSKPLGGVYDHK